MVSKSKDAVISFDGLDVIVKKTERVTANLHVSSRGLSKVERSTREV